MSCLPIRRLLAAPFVLRDRLPRERKIVWVERRRPRSQGRVEQLARDHQPTLSMVGPFGVIRPCGVISTQRNNKVVLHGIRRRAHNPTLVPVAGDKRAYLPDFQKPEGTEFKLDGPRRTGN